MHAGQNLADLKSVFMGRRNPASQKMGDNDSTANVLRRLVMLNVVGHSRLQLFGPCTFIVTSTLRSSLYDTPPLRIG
jgi:hypothetical protein